MTIYLFLFLSFIGSTESAFCGSSAIPYSLEVLPSGATVLGCARPNCFGWDPVTGHAATTDASFFSMDGTPDGFFRQGPTQRSTFDPNDPRVYPQQIADCAPSFSAQCGSNQWVAGINSSSTGPALQCCTFNPLSQAIDRGVAAVHPGQIVIGGEVAGQQGVQTHFDYISNIEKVPSPDGSFRYDVGIGRFPCQEIPSPAIPSPFIQQQFVPVQPAPQPVYYPPVAAAPAAAAASSSYFCFTADTLVRLIDGSEKRMDELEKDDWVQTLTDSKSAYIPVTFWLHRMPSQRAEFVRLALSDGNVLKLTGKHYIYKTACDVDGSEADFAKVSREAVFADTVEEGDCLYSVPKLGRPVVTRVVDVSTVRENGIYAPMTGNGKIVVNGVYASCHSVLQSHSLQNTFFGYVDYLNDVYQRLFGNYKDNMRDLPLGLDTLMSMAEYVIPKNIITL